MQELLSYPAQAGYPALPVFAISYAGVYWITRFRG